MMAEKRQELSEFDRGRVVGAHDAGISERRIVDMYGFARTTVDRVIKDYEERGFTKAAPRSGKPPKLQEDDKSRLLEIVEDNHLASLSEITAQMRNIILDDVSESTIRRALHTEGYFGRVGMRKPFISEINRQKRLLWANERLSWRKDWNFITWSDKSRYFWDELERRLRQRPKVPRNEDELFEFLLEDWKNISLNIIENLNRVLHVREAEGYPTKY